MLLYPTAAFVRGSHCVGYFPNIDSSTLRIHSTSLLCLCDIYDGCYEYCFCLFCFFLNNRFYSSAQPVRGSTLRDLLDKPCLQVFSLLPPGTYMPSFLLRIGFSIPTSQLFMLVDLHRFLLTHALALSARHFFTQEPSPYEHEYALNTIRTGIIDLSGDSIHLLLHRGRLIAVCLHNEKRTREADLRHES